MDAMQRYLCQEGRDKYVEAVELNDTKSQSDPETEPFKSKYQARENWMSIKTEIESHNEYNVQQNETSPTNVFHLAALNYRLGTNFMETEELSSGDEYLKKCIALLQPLG